MTSELPFTAPYDLAGLAVRGAAREVNLTPSKPERAATAAWLGIEGIERLQATVTLSRESDDRYTYATNFDAEVVQACVITLEPVTSHISGEFKRVFRVRPKTSNRRRKAPEEPAAAFELSADENEPEVLDSPILDLAGPVIEELSLALDPYPKAPGATFESPAEEADSTESPFAVLKELKIAPAAPGKGQTKAARTGKKGG